MLIGLTVAGRIAMRGFYERACGRAFAQWEANPSLGESVDALLLAELAGLTPQDAWNARQFLERKAAVIGLGYQEAGEPNHRRYRFPPVGRQCASRRGKTVKDKPEMHFLALLLRGAPVRCDGGRGIGEHLRRGGPARLRRAVGAHQQRERPRRRRADWPAGDGRHRHRRQSAAGAGHDRAAPACTRPLLPLRVLDPRDEQARPDRPAVGGLMLRTDWAAAMRAKFLQRVTKVEDKPITFTLQ